MKDRSATEYALEEVRSAPEALRAAIFVAEALLDGARARRSLPSTTQLQRARAAVGLADGHGLTRSGDPVKLLREGPQDGAAVAVLNCFFAVGVVARLQGLPEENRRGYVHEVVRRADHLLAETPFTPYEYLPFIAPAQLGVQVWDRLVESLIDEVNGSGALPSTAALVRAESLRHLPAEVRGAYVRRILAGCVDPDAGLRYCSLFATLEDPAPVASAPERPQTSSARTAPVLPPGRLGAPAVARPDAGDDTGLEPPPLRGVRDPGPESVWIRGVLLLTGLLLLRESLRALLRLCGFRRGISLRLESESLLIDEDVTWWGRVLWRRRRTWPARTVACAIGDSSRRYLLLHLGLSVLTLVAAFAAPLLLSPTSAAARDIALVAGAVILAGVLLDLLHFAIPLWRGGLRGAAFLVPGERFRVAVGSPRLLARFLTAAHRVGLSGIPIASDPSGAAAGRAAMAASSARPPKLDG